MVLDFHTIQNENHQLNNIVYRIFIIQCYFFITNLFFLWNTTLHNEMSLEADYIKIT